MAKKSPEKKNKWTRYIIWMWVLVLGPILGFGALIYAVSAEALGPLPSFRELENPKSNQATLIYSSDKKLLGKYFSENRTNVTFDHLSPYLVQGLIATEDERFYDHSGVDLRGLIRAVVYVGGAGGASTVSQQLAKNLFPRQNLSLVKLIIRKLKEWVIAARLERQYTKDEIIAMYFNTFDFINNAVGIESAAHVYFNKPSDSLNLQESAMLVGMAQNPALYNPLKRPEMTMKRREVVLSQMVKNKLLTREVYDSVRTLPLGLDYRIVDHKEGPAPYFREVLRSKVTEILAQKDPKTGQYIYHDTEGNPYNIYKDGLRIYTTLDSRMQAHAEWAVTQHLGSELQDEFFKNLKKRKNSPFDSRISAKQQEQIMTLAMKRSPRYLILTGKQCANCGRRGASNVVRDKINGQPVFRCTSDDCEFVRYATDPDSIPIIFNTPTEMHVFSWKGDIDTVMTPMDSIRYYKSFLQAGLMSMDPHTGFIKAWVGGINYQHFKYDHVYQGRRQVGSTFKPIVYALAIQQGLDPCHEVANYPVIFEKDRFSLPEDWSPKNADGVYGGMISLKYGLANSINTATAWVMKQYGPQAVVSLARKMGITSPLEPVPSLCLGVADLTIYELTGATSTFANKGMWLEPIYLTHIEDKYGNVIYRFKQKREEPMSEETAYIMLNMLKAVVNGACCDPKGKWTGTAMRLRGSRPYAGIKTPFGAKTGTTQNQSDGWFLGITPDLVTGVWVGAEDRSVRFTSLYLGQGANTALPIWGYYMNKVYADPKLDISKEDFERPAKEPTRTTDCKSYKKNNDSGGFDDPFSN
ncbi:MAG: transglycosylase domain-containing protein [Flavobacteriales bacterium]|nr:transglycosylase domain-containing protein [Flavobacteriales bacterium]